MELKYRKLNKKKLEKWRVLQKMTECNNDQNIRNH